MSWNINERFRISGTVDLGTHCPRVHTTGVILQLLGSKKARALLDEVENEKKVEAIIKLRDIKPPIFGVYTEEGYVYMNKTKTKSEKKKGDR